MALISKKKEEIFYTIKLICAIKKEYKKCSLGKSSVSLSSPYCLLGMNMRYSLAIFPKKTDDKNSSVLWKKMS